jgi:hypothetical protein
MSVCLIIEAYVGGSEINLYIVQRIAFVTREARRKYIGAKHEAHLRRELSCCYYTRLDINYKQAGGYTPRFVRPLRVCVAHRIYVCVVWVRW